MAIEEYDKIKLRTGETARVVEILESGVMYIAEVFKEDGISVEHISQKDIVSVFKEIEYPVAQIA